MSAWNLVLPDDGGLKCSRWIWPTMLVPTDLASEFLSSSTATPPAWRPLAAVFCSTVHVLSLSHPPLADWDRSLFSPFFCLQIRLGWIPINAWIFPFCIYVFLSCILPLDVATIGPYQIARFPIHKYASVWTLLYSAFGKLKSNLLKISSD